MTRAILICGLTAMMAILMPVTLSGNGGLHFSRACAASQCGTCRKLNSSNADSLEKLKLDSPVLAAGPTRFDHIGLTWKCRSASDGVPALVFRCSTGKNKSALISISRTGQYTDIFTANGQRHSYRVYSLSHLLKSAPSNTASACASEHPLAASAVEVGTAARLQWDKVSDAWCYKIFRRSSKSRIYKAVASIPNKAVNTVLRDRLPLYRQAADSSSSMNYYTDTGLSLGKRYIYKIFSISPANEILSSAEMKIQPVVKDTWSGGVLAWPVSGVHKISSGFGKRIKPTYGASTYHKGIDIPVDEDTRVKAAASGVVTASAKTSGTGNYIQIRHSDSLSTRYLHLNKRFVKAGKKVTRGQIIGLSGNTGVSTGPHLHLEVICNGKKCDPERWLSMP